VAVACLIATKNRKKDKPKTKHWQIKNCACKFCELCQNRKDKARREWEKSAHNALGYEIPCSPITEKYSIKKIFNLYNFIYGNNFIKVFINLATNVSNTTLLNTISVSIGSFPMLSYCPDYYNTFYDGIIFFFARSSFDLS